MKTWLAVVGIGDDGLIGLTPVARSLLTQAQCVVGGQRHLAMLGDDPRPQIPWQGPIAATVDTLLEYRGQPVCVLASGDPMCYGIGSILARRIPIAEMTIVPVPSAFSLACARLGWDSTQVETLSLCGRDPALLNAVLYPGARILVLSADRHTPPVVAALLQQAGYGASTITVLEHLGGDRERQVSGLAADWPPPLSDPPQDLNMMAIICPAGVSGRSRLPGLADEAFQHDGQLTKREIRALTLSALAPLPGERLWDVGAGAGSIGIEWMRSHARNRAIAIEHHPDRLQAIAHNAATLGVPNLQIVATQAPAGLAALEPPDAIFIGGGLTMDGVFETCWQSLRSGGRLVANGVTVQTEQKIFTLQQQYGGRLTRLSVQRAEPLGRFLSWKAQASITQWTVTKP
jgi:precorrin-6B C5,15-methyltransferase / cobalt-precorrin-6B C5,C15-methyltransferase